MAGTKKSIKARGSKKSGTEVETARCPLCHGRARRRVRVASLTAQRVDAHLAHRHAGLYSWPRSPPKFPPTRPHCAPLPTQSWWKKETAHGSRDVRTATMHPLWRRPRAVSTLRTRPRCRQNGGGATRDAPRCGRRPRPAAAVRGAGGAGGRCTSLRRRPRRAVPAAAAAAGVAQLQRATHRVWCMQEGAVRPKDKPHRSSLEPLAPNDCQRPMRVPSELIYRALVRRRGDRRPRQGAAKHNRLTALPRCCQKPQRSKTTADRQEIAPLGSHARRGTRSTSSPQPT